MYKLKTSIKDFMEKFKVIVFDNDESEYRDKSFLIAISTIFSLFLPRICIWIYKTNIDDF